MSQHVQVLQIGDQGNREAYIAYTFNEESRRLYIAAMIEVRYMPNQPLNRRMQVTRVKRWENLDLWNELRSDLKSTLNLT